MTLAFFRSHYYTAVAADFMSYCIECQLPICMMVTRLSFYFSFSLPRPIQFHDVIALVRKRPSNWIFNATWDWGEKDLNGKNLNYFWFWMKKIKILNRQNFNGWVLGFKAIKLGDIWGLFGSSRPSKIV